MASQGVRAEQFRALHRPGEPLILFNIWDAGSAVAVAQAGAPALATGSYSVALAHGAADGEALDLDLVIANLARIVAAVNIPVSLDFETGYGESPGAVGRSVRRALDAGAIGFNLEDGLLSAPGLRAPEDQAERLAAARKAADQIGVPAFLNARTDGFLQTDPAAHDEALLEEALARGAAYAAAGADGLFVPGLYDEGLIARLCAESPLPVNLMVNAKSPPLARLAALGAARLSHGPGPWRLAMTTIADAARALYAGA